MKIVTWNVNSIRTREERLLLWLEKERPDIVCLQETKVVDEKFPEAVIREAGYFSTFHGQKTYNGVAILSRQEPTESSFGIGGYEDPQARVVRTRFGDLTTICAYFPNGKTIHAPEYQYKIEWMTHLLDWIATEHDPSEPVVLAGDFNVAPFDDDAHDADRWAESVLCDSAVRDLLCGFVEWGFHDVFRQHHPEGGIFSWWDYRQLAFPRNEGLRIDHVYVTEGLYARNEEVVHEREPRTWDTPSDHLPVRARFGV